MIQTIRYAGHQYRLAQEPEAAEEQPTEKPCAEPQPDDPLVKLSERVLSGAKIKGEAIRVCQEQDGADVDVSVGGAWSGIEAVLKFDYSRAGKLQELILGMCGQSFVAHGAEMIKMLLGAVQTLQSAKFSPQAPTGDVEDKKKTEYIEFLRHYITELLLGAVELSYENRQKFAAEIKQLDKYPQERANVLAEGALRVTDVDWEAHIIPLVESQGKQYATTQEMIDNAVQQLIPAEEKYTGGANVLTYLDDGNILVGIDIPKPAESFLFVFQHAAGQNRLSLVDAGLGLCGASFTAGTDGRKAGALVSTMVDLAVLSEQTAQPELSQPPKLVVKEWDSKDLANAFSKGLVIWYGANGNIRMTWEGTQAGSCRSAEEFEKNELNEDVSTLKNLVKIAQKDKRAFLQVHPDGKVDQLGYDFAVIQKNITTVDAKKQTCEIR